MPLSQMLDHQVPSEPGGETIPCRDYDAELWFAERPEDVEFAKTLCGMCPVRSQCLAGALERHEPWGVSGRGAGPVSTPWRPETRPSDDADGHQRKHGQVQRTTTREDHSPTRRTS